MFKYVNSKSVHMEKFSGPSYFVTALVQFEILSSELNYDRVGMISSKNYDVFCRKIYEA